MAVASAMRINLLEQSLMQSNNHSETWFSTSAISFCLGLLGPFLFWMDARIVSWAALQSYLLLLNALLVFMNLSARKKYM
jgi:hypothetical protein